MLTTSFRFPLAHFLVGALLSTVGHSSDMSGALSGLQLRCCILDEPPIAFIDDRTYANGGVSGIIAQYLREMQGYLNWSCSSVQHYTGGKQTSFNHFVRMMEDCSENGAVRNDPGCTCDIGISGWFQNHHRFRRVDFLPPFVTDGYEVVFHISNSEVSGRRMFFITTFDRLAWVSIFGLMLLFSAIKFFDRKFCPIDSFEALEETNPRIQRFVHVLMKYPTLYRFRRALQSTFSRMILLPDSDVVENQTANRQWVLNTVISVSGLFLILSYEASMTASLVQETVSAGFQSIQDFQTCRISPAEVCLPGGGALEMFWNTSIAIEVCHKQRQPFFASSYDELFHAVDNRTCKYGLLLESTANAAINSKYCGKLLAAEKPIYSGGLAMVLPKNSNLTDVMSYATLKITNEVATPGIEQYFASIPKCSINPETTLNFRKLRLFFGIALCTGAFLLLLRIINNVWNQAIERRVEDKEQSKLRDIKTMSSSNCSIDISMSSDYNV
ncbi:Glutamate receptor 1 [Gracilariopsis chorda]|uniref:Glutamate receptor 1 n=1 Tax=Gracilariopsis chorda TaxID=448386 RepID=A0A2V3IME4_9FLOR|nr:Glutamate receptor 1 [Gracilariopsis chorda]|eukprot:PXF43253.1 Glutamate receptor 1 [Gracilariopsis chorda]